MLFCSNVLKRPLLSVNITYRGQITRGFSILRDNQLIDSFSKIVLDRHSVGRFDPKIPVNQDDLKQILALTLRSPSGFNMTPYKVILVDADDAKKKLALGMIGSGNIFRVLDAPISAIFLADKQAIRYVDKIVTMERDAGKPPAYLRNIKFDASVFAGDVCQAKNTILSSALHLGSKFAPMPTPNTQEGWAMKNTSLACMTYMLACTAYGLTTHAMEGLDMNVIRREFNIPSNFDVPIVISTGYPWIPGISDSKDPNVRYSNADYIPKKSARLAPENIFCKNSLNVPFEGIKQL